MFRSFANQLTMGSGGLGGKADGDKKKEERTSMHPALRSDVYQIIDLSKSWIQGGGGGGAAGDGVSVGPLISIINRHFPETKLESVTRGHVESEVAAVIGGGTNMILELSRWEGMAGGMAMRTWVDSVTTTYSRIPETDRRRSGVAKGIVGGVNEFTDVTLLSKEFATRIQIISQLKTVTSKIYGAGSEEARVGEAVWSSKFI